MVFRRSGRCSLNIALLVEGVTDTYILPVLIKRILGERTGVEKTVLNGAGNMLNEDKIIPRLNSFSKDKSISKIIICKDSECTPDTETRKELENLRKTVDGRKTYSKPIHYVVVNHAPEGWLLGDSEAIARYLNERTKIKTSATADCRPKELLEDLFRKAGKYLIARRDYPKLSASVDIQKICSNNQSFKYFYEIIRDP